MSLKSLSSLGLNDFLAARYSNPRSGYGVNRILVVPYNMMIPMMIDGTICKAMQYYKCCQLDQSIILPNLTRQTRRAAGILVSAKGRRFVIFCEQ